MMPHYFDHHEVKRLSGILAPGVWQALRLSQCPWWV